MSRNEGKQKNEVLNIRLHQPAAKVLIAIQDYLEAKSGDEVTQAEILHHALRLLATALDPSLLPAPSVVDLISSAVARQLPGTNEGNR